MADLQWMRAERYTARTARLVTTYSGRVARVVGHGARVVPIGYPVPAARALPLRDPVAGMIADWRWAPNRPALEHLLRGWPYVRAGLPDARLVLAGNGSDLLGTALPDGVDLLGPVPKIAEFWEQVGLLAFPAVATSGPKVKVLEALAFGVPVVTTEWGVEGLAPAARRSVVVTTLAEFARVCLDVLADPDRRAALGVAGRQAVLDEHAPAPAAKARAAVLADAFRAE
jgi:glycosyltransferase involved in cell wall biosynthesis